MSNLKFTFDSQLRNYLQAMVTRLPNASKLIMQALSTKAYNKEDLSIQSRVRRGELNYAIIWLEGLGFVEYDKSGRQKLYSLSSLGELVYEDFKEIFHALKEEEY